MRRDDTNPPQDRPPSMRPPGASPPSEGQADKDHLRQLQRDRQARVAKAAVALVLAGILVAFIVANSQSVPVRFVFFTRRPALIWVMFACALLGGILGYLIGRPGRQVRFHRGKEQPPRR